MDELTENAVRHSVINCAAPWRAATEPLLLSGGSGLVSGSGGEGGEEGVPGCGGRYPMSTMSPVVADAFRLLHRNLYEHLAEVECLALQLERKQSR